MNEPGNQKDQEQRASHLASPAEPREPRQAEEESGRQEKEAGGKRDRIASKLEGFSPFFEGIVAVAALVGVALVVIQIWFLWRTDRVSQESLRISRDALQLTREGSASSDKATERTWKLMEESNRLTREALEENKRQAEASRTQSAGDAAANLGLSRKSLEASQRALEVSQRAHLAAVSYGEFPLVAGSEREASVGIKNTGHLPATNVGVLTNWVLWNEPIPDITELKAASGDTTLRVVIAPGTDPQIFGMPVRGFNEEEIKAINEGRRYLYFYGRATYNDGFGHTRHLSFCAVHERNAKTWAVCPNNNTVD